MDWRRAVVRRSRKSCPVGTEPVPTFEIGDLNGDGNVDNLDITPFVDLLTGGGSPVPEPATMVVLGLGALGVVVRKRRRSHA